MGLEQLIELLTRHLKDSNPKDGEPMVYINVLGSLHYITAVDGVREETYLVTGDRVEEK